MTTEQYNQCVEQYADGLYRFILKNIRDEEKARDIVQDTFEKLWIKVKTVSFEKSKSYVFTTGYHTMIDDIRKNSRMQEMDTGALNSLTVKNDYNDLNEILHDALDKLPEIQRSVILLRDYEGYSYQEIGEITKLNESQVKVYIYRARNFLKEYIGSLDTVV